MMFIRQRAWRLLGVALCGLCLSGCGTTKSQTATEQLALSDAVDRAVAAIDFSDFAGHKVFIDQTYLPQAKDFGFVNAGYITSSIRQQVASHGGLLQAKEEEAEFILELRAGTLGTDHNTFTFGLPSTQGFSAVGGLVQNAPPIPTLPELSFAKREDQRGAAKIAVFAYHRVTREPVWQAGMSLGKSSSRAVWLAGAGPFRTGTVERKAVQFDALGLQREQLSEEELQRYYQAQAFHFEDFKGGIQPAAREVPFTPSGIQQTGHGVLKPVEPPALQPTPEAKPTPPAETKPPADDWTAGGK